MPVSFVGLPALQPESILGDPPLNLIMQAFLEYVVKGLVDHPGDVSVTPVVKDEATLYELRLHPDDVGRIIGRQGNTIHAIRGLLQVGAAKKGERCSLEIVEEAGGLRRVRSDRGASPEID